MTYHAGDFILRIKNAYQARNKQVEMPYSNISKAIAHVLIKEGFLASVEEKEVEGKRVLVANLRYENRRPVMHDVKLISKPSLRVYVDVNGLGQEKDRTVTTIVSTSTGVITGKEAMKKGVGGELLFKVW